MLFFFFAFVGLLLSWWKGHEILWLPAPLALVHISKEISSTKSRINAVKSPGGVGLNSSEICNHDSYIPTQIQMMLGNGTRSVAHWNSGQWEGAGGREILFFTVFVLYSSSRLFHNLQCCCVYAKSYDSPRYIFTWNSIFSIRAVHRAHKL